MQCDKIKDIDILKRGPGAVAKSVEYVSHVWEIVGLNPWSSQTNSYLSLSSQVLNIIRIGQELVGSVS